GVGRWRRLGRGSRAGGRGSRTLRRMGSATGAGVRPRVETMAPDPPLDPSPDAPELYPWPERGVQAAMLHREGVRELDPRADLEQVDEALRDECDAPLADRTLVVAVGYTLSQADIATKY